MFFSNSIRWRLQIWHGLILLAVLGGFGLTAWRLEQERYNGFLKLDAELAQLGARTKTRRMTEERRSKRDHKIKARNRADRIDIERDLKPRA